MRMKMFSFKLKEKLIFLTMAFFCFFIFSSTFVRAFSYSGIRWWGTTVYVRYDSSVPNSWQSSGALYRARTAWNTAGSRFRLYYNSDSDNEVKAGYYGRTYWLAKTTVYFNWLGYISQADLVFNRTYSWSTSGDSDCYDVQNVATHEFGHWLQLKDLYSSSDYWKTMYGYAETGEIYKRTLHSDDIAGIKHIYGI